VKTCTTRNALNDQYDSTKNEAIINNKKRLKLRGKIQQNQSDSLLPILAANSAA
jgi:hypothetical protein